MGYRPVMIYRLFLVVGVFLLSSAGLPGIVAGDNVDSSFRPQVNDVPSTEPLLLRPGGSLLKQDLDSYRIFMAKNGGEIRQGGFRIWAPHFVVWVDKNVSLSDDGLLGVDVYVYAEGVGPAGGEPSKYVKIVSDDIVKDAGAVCVKLRTSVGISWDRSVREAAGLESDALFQRGRKAAAGLLLHEYYLSENIPHRQAIIGPPPPITHMLQARKVRIFTDDDTGEVTAVYVGDVRGKYGNVDITADVAVLWLDQKTNEVEIYARGDVILRKAPDAEPRSSRTDSLGIGEFRTIRADRIFLSPATEKGFATRFELRIAPDPESDEIYVVQGRELQMLDENNFQMEEARFTNCPFGDPHYEFKAQTMRMLYSEPDIFVSAWDVDVVTGVEEEPLVGFPFLNLNLSDPEYVLRSVAFGSGDNKGTFLETAWRPTHLGLDRDWIDNWTVYLDYYSKRGIGIGTELDYVFGDEEDKSRGQFGSLKGYYINDDGSEDDTGLAVPKKERGRFWWQHRLYWNEWWRTDLEYYWMSDVGFLNEYFEPDFENHRAPETYIFNRYRRDNLWIGMTLKTQVNDFMTQVEQLPGAELHWLAQPVGPFLYNATVDAGYYDLEISDELTERDPDGLFRAHTRHVLSSPFGLGFVRFDPFVELLGTYASKGAFQNGSQSGSESTAGWGAGLRTSADFSRIYNVESKFFDLNRLRHVITPYVETYIRDTSGDSEDFVQLGGRDPWPRFGRGPRPRTDRISAIDNLSEVRVGLRQQFQTKRGEEGSWSNVDWIDMDIAYISRSDDSVAVPEDDDYIDADFTWRLTDEFTIFSRDNRISQDDGIDVYNLGVGWTPSADFSTSLNYYRLVGESSNVNFAMSAKLSDRYALYCREEYDFDSNKDDDSKSLETTVLLQRFFHKWQFYVGLDVEHRRDSQNEIIFGFAPTAFGISTESPIDMLGGWMD